MDFKLFLIRHDIEAIIDLAESQCELQYTESGLFESADVKYYTSMIDVPGLGLNFTGKYITGLSLIACHRGTAVNVSTIQQKHGGYLYSIDQSCNPDSVIIQPGGVFQGIYIIRGGIGTTSDTKKSLELYNLFRSAASKICIKVKGWHIGPAAYALSNSGHRLITMHAQQDPKYDLAKP